MDECAWLQFSFLTRLTCASSVIEPKLIFPKGFSQYVLNFFHHED